MLVLVQNFEIAIQPKRPPWDTFFLQFDVSEEAGDLFLCVRTRGQGGGNKLLEYGTIRLVKGYQELMERRLSALRQDLELPLEIAALEVRKNGLMVEVQELDRKLLAMKMAHGIGSRPDEA